MRQWRQSGSAPGYPWELLEYLAKFDSVFLDRLHGRLLDSGKGMPGSFTSASADIQNDLIECIDSIIQDEIDKIVRDCIFLTIEIDKTTDVSTKEQLGEIIRLVQMRPIVCPALELINF